MNNVLYYSNFCEYSKKIIAEYSRLNIKSSTYFISIDKRTKKGQQTYIILENGKEVPLPDIIKSVPSLVICSRGNMLLEGDQIYNYINQYRKQEQPVNDEPMCYSFNSGIITSDTYSFIDTDPEELSAKGNGGTRQMHNFVSFDYMDNIATPEENYVPNTIGNDDNNLNKLIEQRDNDIPKPVKPI